MNFSKFCFIYKGIPECRKLEEEYILEISEYERILKNSNKKNREDATQKSQKV